MSVDYHYIRHTELTINCLNEPPYKFGIKIWLIADMNNQCFLPSVKPVTQVRNYRQITEWNIIAYIYYIDFQFVILDNIAHYVTDEDYEAGESRGIKPDIDDFTPIQYRKKSDHNRKTFSSHSRYNPLFLIKFQFDFQP